MDKIAIHEGVPLAETLDTVSLAYVRAYIAFVRLARYSDGLIGPVGRVLGGMKHVCYPKFRCIQIPQASYQTPRSSNCSPHQRQEHLRGIRRAKLLPASTTVISGWIWLLLRTCNSYQPNQTEGRYMWSLLLRNVRLSCIHSTHPPSCPMYPPYDHMQVMWLNHIRGLCAQNSTLHETKQVY